VPVNSRNVTSNHLDGELYLRCPVCQYAIDQDHIEALSNNEELDVIDETEGQNQL
jgi:hypothetical protein